MKVLALALLLYQRIANMSTANSASTAAAAQAKADSNEQRCLTLNGKIQDIVRYFLKETEALTVPKGSGLRVDTPLPLQDNYRFLAVLNFSFVDVYPNDGIKIEVFVESFYTSDENGTIMLHAQLVNPDNVNDAHVYLQTRYLLHWNTNVIS